MVFNIRNLTFSKINEIKFQNLGVNGNTGEKESNDLEDNTRSEVLKQILNEITLIKEELKMITEIILKPESNNHVSSPYK